MTPDLEREVMAALHEVKDPCSVAVGTPLSLVEMGLVRSCDISPDADVRIVLDVTSPMCLMAGHFLNDAQERLSAIPAVRSACVTVDPSGEWTPERIVDEGRGGGTSGRRGLARARIGQ
jgi:metal-sulfur cluster biosynthetic enzyme